MVPEDLTRLLFVTDPQLSPDGRRIAFVVTSLSEERDEYLSNIWIVDVATAERVYEIAGRISAAPGPGGRPTNMPIEVRQFAEHRNRKEQGQ